MQEVLSSKEVEPQTVHGIGVIMMHEETGKIWTIQEMKDSPKTEKRSGQLSIPLETAKKGEDLYGNLLGALPEIFNDYDVNGNDIRTRLKTAVLRVDKKLAFHSNFMVRKNQFATIQCDLAVVFFSGSPIDCIPYNSDEVAQVGWVGVDEFLSSDARPLAVEAVSQAYESGLLEQNLVRYRYFPERRKPILPSYYSIQQIYEQRELFYDQK